MEASMVVPNPKSLVSKFFLKPPGGLLKPGEAHRAVGFWNADKDLSWGNQVRWGWGQRR